MIKPIQGRYLLCIYLFSSAFISLFVWTLWFGVNSDRDNVPALINQLIPAGHCACQTSLNFQCDTCLHCPTDAPVSLQETRGYNPTYDANNLSLSDAQCQSFFPGLFEDIHRARSFWSSRGGITTDDLDEVPLVDGMARVAIANGQLYVLAVRARGEDHRRKILGALSSIHRALVANAETASRPTEFIFSVEDKLDDIAGPQHPLWILARKPEEESVWLMPDFGFWAWSNGNVDSQIGPYNRVADRIRRDEDGLSWEEKEPKLVWRGKLSFAAKMRRGLLEASRDQPWSDVKELDWGRKANFMSMEDHCRYQFIAHVEGRSYSASLKYRQACTSVVIAHKLQYIQHHHYLMISSGPDQNFVEVERDFSDLPEKMQALLDNPALAEQIARNSVSTFRDRYLSPAAEACYWRALLDGWASASPAVSDYIRASPIIEDGMRYESFLLMDSSEMLHF